MSPAQPKADARPTGEIIQVPNVLRAKVGPRFGGIDPAALARAEAALKELSSNFMEWLQEEIDKLEVARAQVKTEGATIANMNTLHLHAHDLKGLGGTYDYPLITRVAGSLCKMMDDPGERVRAPLFLVDAHIDAIRAIMRDEIRDPAHPVGCALSEALEGHVREHLAAKAA